MGKKINTKIIHEGVDPKSHFGSITDPIYRNSTLIFENYESFLAAKKDRFSLPYYGRIGTYTSRKFEKLVCSLYESEKAIVTSSGLSAITISILSFVEKESELLIVDTCYEPVSNFAKNELSKFNIKSKFYDTNNFKKFKNLINDRTKVIYLESPSSLNFEVQDLNRFSEVAKKKGIITIMDNTWSTFLGCNPLKFGIDIVIESGTKYFSGHSDNFCGIIACSNKNYQKIKETAVRLGDYVSPDSCHLATKGLKTLKVRIDKHYDNAIKVCNFLKKKKIISDIYFVADKQNKYHKLWKKYHTIGNGLLTFSLKKINDCKRFIDSLNLFKIGFSWGGYESLILPLTNMKLTNNLSKTSKYWFRIHVGLESSDDLIKDLENALKSYETK